MGLTPSSVSNDAPVSGHDEPSRLKHCMYCNEHVILDRIATHQRLESSLLPLSESLFRCHLQQLIRFHSDGITERERCTAPRFSSSGIDDYGEVCDTFTGQKAYNSNMSEKLRRHLENQIEVDRVSLDPFE